MSEIKLKTTPYDARFPNTNQSQHCWTRYNEHVTGPLAPPSSSHVACRFSQVAHCVLLRAVKYFLCDPNNRWIMCSKKAGADSAECKQARRFMHGICPTEWVERWDEEREEGKFAGLQ